MESFIEEIEVLSKAPSIKTPNAYPFAASWISTLLTRWCRIHRFAFPVDVLGELVAEEGRCSLDTIY